MTIEVGQEAPDFTLKNSDNEDVTLSSFRGHKNVVLLFYPLAFSGACTTQFTRVAANESRYAGENAQVIAVSVDNRFVQGAFARTLGLDDAILLADFEPKGAVARTYGVYLDERGYSGRAVFVIDTSGIVRSAQVVPPPEQPDDDADFETLATCNT